jgi:hypothetical protein
VTGDEYTRILWNSRHCVPFDRSRWNPLVRTEVLDNLWHIPRGCREIACLHITFPQPLFADYCTPSVANTMLRFPVLRGSYWFYRVDSADRNSRKSHSAIESALGFGCGARKSVEYERTEVVPPPGGRAARQEPLPARTSVGEYSIWVPRVVSTATGPELVFLCCGSVV